MHFLCFLPYTSMKLTAGRTRSSSVAVQESNPQSQDKALGDSRAGVSIDPMPPQPSGA